MGEKPIRRFKVRRSIQIWFAVFACAGIVTGCSERKRPAIQWSTAALARPIIPTPYPGKEPIEEPLPELELEVPPPSKALLVRSVPPRPRGALTPTTENNSSDKPDVPVLMPQLTAEETAASQQQWKESLNVAERNLNAMRGIPLDANQRDLASKVRGFIADARGAAQTGDWTRARNLARKAQVLSEDLRGLP